MAIALFLSSAFMNQLSKPLSKDSAPLLTSSGTCYPLAWNSVPGAWKIEARQPGYGVDAEPAGASMLESTSGPAARGATIITPLAISLPVYFQVFDRLGRLGRSGM